MKRLQRRKVEFEQFIQERMPVLVEFCELLKLENPHEVLLDAERFVWPLHAWLRDETIKEDDRLWLLVRYNYFIGELLIQKFGGCWMVDEDPRSQLFSNYVVGEFRLLNNKNVKIFPYEIALEFIDHPPGRDLVKLLETVIIQMKEA